MRRISARAARPGRRGGRRRDRPASVPSTSAFARGARIAAAVPAQRACPCSSFPPLFSSQRFCLPPSPHRPPLPPPNARLCSALGPRSRSSPPPAMPPPRNFSPLRSQFLPFNVSSLLGLPPATPALLRRGVPDSFCSPRLSRFPAPRRAAPQLPPGPGGSGVPSPRRGCSAESGSRRESDPAGGGEDGAPRPRAARPNEHEETRPQCISTGQGAPGPPLSRLPSLDPPRPLHNRCSFLFRIKRNTLCVWGCGWGSY